jgi:ribosome biogenesis GTPase
MPETGGRTEEQILAANIDTVFLVSGLDGDFNIRRIERYLSAAWNSGATPVILLNKADICPEVDKYVEEVETLAFGVPIHVVSASENTGMGSLDAYLGPGMTSVFLGSSGVGKSTIINSLLDEERLLTNAVREHDSRGRHTTTYRQMILLRSGGIVIDTPGMRELQPWDREDGIGRTFEDVEHLAALCKFNDCSHETEPGCAVRMALEDGSLDEKRYGSYLKLQKERRFLEMRKDKAAKRQFVRNLDKRIRQHLRVKKDLKKEGLL